MVRDNWEKAEILGKILGPTAIAIGVFFWVELRDAENAADAACMGKYEFATSLLDSGTPLSIETIRVFLAEGQCEFELEALDAKLGLDNLAQRAADLVSRIESFDLGIASATPTELVPCSEQWSSYSRDFFRAATEFISSANEELNAIGKAYLLEGDAANLVDTSVSRLLSEAQAKMDGQMGQIEAFRKTTRALELACGP